MARTRFSNRRALQRRPRRKLIWARDSDGVIIPVDTVSTFNRYLLDSFETDYGANLIGCTIMRVRGVITAALAGDSDTQDGYAAARVGMRITDHADLDQTDYAEGAMYGGQAQADWFFFEPFMLDAGSDIAAGDHAELTSGSEIRHIDVRSRRRIGELQETLELIAGRPASTSTSPPFNTMAIRLRWDLSVLIALP